MSGGNPAYQAAKSPSHWASHGDMSKLSWFCSFPKIRLSLVMLVDPAEVVQVAGDFGQQPPGQDPLLNKGRRGYGFR